MWFVCGLFFWGVGGLGGWIDIDIRTYIQTIPPLNPQANARQAVASYLEVPRAHQGVVRLARHARLGRAPVHQPVGRGCVCFDVVCLSVVIVCVLVRGVKPGMPAILQFIHAPPHHATPLHSTAAAPPFPPNSPNQKYATPPHAHPPQRPARPVHQHVLALHVPGWLVVWLVCVCAYACVYDR